MNTLTERAGAAIIVAAMLATFTVRADEQPSAMDADSAMAEMMQKAQEAGSPGAAHKVLDPLVGEWDAEVKLWMTPDAPPTVNTATAKSTWAFDGRFVRQEFTGEFMGTPFHGVSFTGYDNVRGKYNSVWIDDMSTTMVTAEGEADAAGKVLTFEGTYACAMTGEPHKVSRQIYRIVSPDRIVFEMHDPTLGEQSKTMEITYTRR